MPLRFAIWITGDASAYTQVKYGSYADLFLQLLEQSDEHWDVFDVQREAYPPAAPDYDGVVITGSAATAHEREPWIEKLNERIGEAYRHGVKILGVCFGHQAVANALGGRSCVNPGGWEVGLHRLDPRPSFHQLPWSAGLEPTMSVLQIHRDHVSEVPPGAEVHASTPQTPVQMYTLGRQVFCMQGHPEFFNDIIADLTRERQKNGTISTEVAREAESSLEREADREKMRQLLRRFLRDSV